MKAVRAHTYGGPTRGRRKLQLRIEKEFPLSEADAARRQLEARKTTGKVLLLL